ncbi:hypothetical protein ACFCWY_13800 [Streptomyces sp. NPDC056362]|uniref:hypothetical protein n=1 Tax=unclassified Streptomyces TaxID=2593676 RepID=UPI0035D622EA
MQMTEPFATTVAAVAPVLILVGVVEVKVWEQKVREASLSMLGPLRERLATISQAEAEEEFEAAFADLKRDLQALGEGPTPGMVRAFWRWIPMRAIAMIWAVMSVALVAVEIASLIWLATPEPTPDENRARVMIAVLGIGMALAITPALSGLLMPLPLLPPLSSIVEAMGGLEKTFLAIQRMRQLQQRDSVATHHETAPSDEAADR